MTIQRSVVVIVVAVLTLVGLRTQADQYWDGDDSSWNFGANNNWYGNSQPAWGYGGGGLHFAYQNTGTGVWNDYGIWVNTESITWDTTYPGSFQINGAGNGINFNTKIENNSSYAQVLNIPVSGAKNGATWFELNPVNGNLTISNSVSNDSSVPYRVYGNNGKSLILSGSLLGNTSASLTVQQNSTVQVTTRQGFAGDVVAVAGAIRISTDNPLPGSFVRLGGTSGESTWANLYLDGGYTLTNQLNAQANNSGVLTIGNTFGVAGTATFSGNMYLDHDTTLFSTNAGGTLVLSGSVLDLKNQLLTVDGAGATTISGPLYNSTGSGRLLKTGAGTLTLSSTSSTNSGGTTLSAGTLLVQGNSTPTAAGSTVTSGPLGKGTLTINGGTFGFVGGGYTIANNVSVGGAANIEVASGQNEVLNGNWSGSGNLTLIANGTTAQWQFGGDNSGYTGTLTQNSGNTSLAFNNANSGSAGAAWIFNNGTAQRTRLNFGAGTISFGSLSGNGSIANVAGSGASTMSVGALNTSTTFSGIIGDGAGQAQNVNLLKVGTGSLTLSGGSKHTGTTTVQNGSLIAGAAVTVSANGPFGNAASAIALGDATSISGNLSPSLLIGGAYAVTRPVTVGASNGATTGLYTLGGNSASSSTFGGLITLNQSCIITQAASGTLAITNGITTGSGTVALTKTGAGTLILTTANTYTGGSTLNGGTIILSNDTALASSGNIAFTGGTLLFGTGYTTDLSARIRNSTSPIIIDNNSQAITFAGNIDNSNSGGLTKNGAGALTLSGANTFSGNVTNSAGTLTLGSTTALGNGALVMTGGNLDSSVADLVNANNNAQFWNSDFTFAGSQNLNLGAGAVTPNALRTVTVTAKNLTVGGAIGGTYELDKLGAGTLTLSGTGSTYTGGTRANAGTMVLSGTRSGTTGWFSLNNVGAQNAVVKVLPGADWGIADFNIAEAANSRGAIYQSGGTITVNNNTSSAFKLGSGASSYGYYNLSGGALTLAGAAGEIGIGAIGQNATLGVMDITGGTLTGKTWLLVGRGNTTSSGLLNVTGGSVSFGTTTANHMALNWAGTAGGISVVNVGGGAGSATVTGPSSTTKGADLAAGNTAGTLGVLNLLANGTLTVGIVTAGNANPTANLNFNGGTLKATASNAGGSFMTSGNIDGVYIYPSGAIIDDSGTSITINRPLLAPTSLGVTNIAVSTAGSGYIGAPMVVITGGTGSGATAIANMVDDGTANGTYKVDGITITSPGVYTVAPTTVTLNGGGASSAATIGAISTAANASGGLTKLGSGTLTLSGTSTYTNTTTISSGTLSISADANLGATGASAAPVLLNGGTLKVTTGHTGTHPITVGASGGAINVTAGTGQYYLHTAGTLLGSGTLTLTGSGTLTANSGNLRVDVANSYSGNMIMQAGGIFEYGASGAVGAGATLTLNDNGEVSVASGVTLPNAITVASGANNVLSFENGVAGIFSGSITLNTNVVIGLRDWYNNATVRSGTINGTISGAGGLTVNSGSGSGGLLTLGAAANNTFTGGVTVTSSTLQISTDAQLGAVPAVPTVNITLNGGNLYNNNTSPSISSARTISLGASGGYLQAGWAPKSNTVNGLITGVGGLGINWDGGVVILNAVNDYQGDTTIGTTGPSYYNNVAATPTLRLGIDNALPYGASAGNVVFGTGLNNTATLDLYGHNAQINGLSGSGTKGIVDNSTGSGPYILTVGNKNASSTFAGVIKNTSGSVALTKVGSGTQTLSNTNTFTGATVVSNGTLALSCPWALSNSASIGIVAGATCDVSVISGGYTLGAAQTLKGAGWVKGDLTTLGTVSPGFSPGTLTIEGNYTNSGTLQIEIASALSYDQVIVTGDAVLGGTLTVSNLSDYALAPGSTYTVVTASAISGAFTATNIYPALLAGQTLVINNTGTAIVLSVTGTPAANTYWWDQNQSVAGLGGAGTWDTATTTWRSPSGSDLLTVYPNTASSGDTAVFADTAGEVTHSGTLNVNTLVFGADGYTLSGGTFDLSGATGAGVVVSNGVVATVASGLTGNNTLNKTGAGSLILSGVNDYSGNTTNTAGTLVLGSTTAIGSGALVLNGGNLDSAVADLVNANNNAQYWNGDFTFLGSQNLNLGTGAASMAADRVVTISAGTLTLGGGITNTAASGLKILTVTNAGNLVVNGAITGGGSTMNLLKAGAGTLTLAGGASFSGNGVNGYLPGSSLGPIVLRQGTTRFTGGAYGVTGELVIGGVVANGGAGQNSSLVVDGGSLSVSTWLSLGRGNGTGTVASDLILTNGASVSVANFSAGYSGGSALNLPKGSATLSGNSALTITGNGAIQLAESAGSDFTMTLNDSAQLLATGTGIKYFGMYGTGTLNVNGTSVVTLGNAVANIGYRTGTGTVNVAGGTLTLAGELRVGGSDASGTGYNSQGTLTLTSGTVGLGSLTLARGNNNQNGCSGTVVVNGGILTSTNDVLVGFEGAGSARLVVGGGTVNVGPSATKWLYLGDFSTANGRVDVTNGWLNLMNNSCIKFSPGNTGTATSNVVNQTGGTVTFYSNNGVTVGGSGDLNLQQSGSASVNNTYNLDGGTLIVPAVGSTLATGTRAFNFNGGTLMAAKDNASFFNLGAGAAVANVRNGGAFVDDNGKAVTIAQALVHSTIGGDNATDGGLTKSGAGTLTLSGVNTFNGGLTITAGTLTISSAGQLGGGTYAANVSNGGTLNYASSASQTLSGQITGVGALTMSGSGTLVLSGANSYSGATTVSAGALQLNGATTLSTNSVLTLSGGTLALRSDADATFAPASITNIVNGSTISVDQITSGHGSHTLTLGGNFYINGNATLNLACGNGDTLALGTINLNAGSQTETLSAGAGAKVTVAGVQAYGVYDNIAFSGAGNIDVLGAMIQNTSPRWLGLQFNQTGTATVWAANNLLGSNNGNPAYAAPVNLNNGVTVFNNSSALSSVGPIRAYLGASSGSSSATVLLGGTDIAGLLGGVNLNPFLWGGIINVQDGTSGVLTIGGQNTSGVNTWGCNFTLGTTTDTGKSVTLLAATGGEVDFTGVLAKNGADTTAGVTVGDATHAGTIKFANANTYGGPTMVSNGTLIVTRNLASSAVTNAAGTTLRVTNVTFSGSLTLLDSAALSLTNGAANDVLSVNGLTLNGGNSITLEVGSSNDSINLVGGTYTPPSSGVVTINLVGRSGLAAGTYNLITGCNITDTNNFVIGSKSGTGGFQYELQAGGGNLQLVVSVYSGQIWWKGRVDGLWNGSSAGSYNWDTDQSSGADAETYPGNVCDAYFAANDAANYATTLGQDFTIRSLSLLTASNVTIAGANTLTLSNGITMGASAGSNTISVATVTMAADQTWSNASANELVVSAAVTGSGRALAKTGSGKLTLSGANTYSGTTTVGGGMIDVATGGQVNSAGTGGGNYIVVGNTSGQNAMLKVSGGAANLVTSSGNAWASYLQAGNGSGYRGFINMTAGSLNPQRHLALGNNGGYGAMTMGGGTLTVGSYFIVGFRQNTAGGSGVFNQSGGTATQNQTSGAGATLIGSGANSVGVVNLNGGSFTATAGGVFVPENNACTGTLTIARSALLTVGNVGIKFGNSGSGQKGVVNLNGGTVVANIVQKGAGIAILNFNGGTLIPSGASTTFMQGLTAAYVHGGGAVVSNAYDITIGQTLLAPSGYGVSSIPVTGNGSGYLDTPLVFITGGSGSNATAVAQIDYAAGTVTNILVTSPGDGYGSGDTLTATLSGGGGSGATLGSVSLVANTSGGLTKQGTGTLTLSGANTFTGATTVSNGTLAVTGSLAAPVTLVSGATLSGSGSISNSLTLESGAKVILTNGAAATLTVTGGLALNTATLSFDVGVGNDKIAMTGGSFAKSGTTTINLTGLAGVNYGTAYDLITGIGISDTSGFVLGTSPAGFQARLMASGGNLVALIPGPGSVYTYR